MKKEKQKIMNYLEIKKETEILMDVAVFWRRMEHSVSLKEGKAKKAKIKECRLKKRDAIIKFYENCVKPNLELTCWSDWCNRMDEESEASRRMDRLDQVERNKKIFWERLQPKTIFAGCISWWNRM